MGDVEEDGHCAGCYVAGFGSGAGKSTVCRIIIAHLLRAGMASSEIAYIKPATQCEATTEVVAFCESSNVTAVGIGPVVFRPGFTASVIGAANVTELEAGLLRAVVTTVSELRSRHRFVVVDGVGYPSVGSCVGLGNARVAAALRLPVILVGPPGLGDCIDTFDLMRTYFTSYGATVAAALVNKATDTSRHRMSEALPLVARWFARTAPDVRFLGAIRLVVEEGVSDEQLARETELPSFLDALLKLA